MPRRVRRPQPTRSGPSAAELEQQIDRLARAVCGPRPWVEGVAESPYGVAYSQLAGDFARERERMERERVPLADQLAHLQAFAADGRAAIDHLPRGPVAEGREPE